MKKFLAICLSMMIPSIGFASLEKELEDFFDYLGTSSNFNSADVYNGQKAGYATGGSATIRNRSMRIQPGSMNMPRLDAGCGGIDLYTGGFSFVNSDQLIQAMKSIGSNAAGYAFLLGIETVSPQVSNNLKQLQTWSNNINGMNIGSCELASQMVGSVWPRDTAAKEHICKTVGSGKGIFDDSIIARQRCRDSKEDLKVEELVLASNPEAIIFRYNIAWEAIQKQGYLTKDTEVAEFLMTLMGTLIVDGSKVSVHPAKAADSDFIRAILEGGETTLYSCDSNDTLCLNMHVRKTKIDKKKSWKDKVVKHLSSIQEKILSDEELSKEEQELLLKTKMPLYKFINVITAYRKGVCPIELAQLADVIATDLLIQYLRGSVESVRVACQKLKSNAMYSNQIDEYVNSLASIDRYISYYSSQASTAMQQEIFLLEKMELLEAHIASELCL